MIIGFEARNQKPVRYALEESVKESGNMKMFHFPFPVGDNGNIIVASICGYGFRPSKSQASLFFYDSHLLSLKSASRVDEMA